jgi:hypothetical protein
VFAAALWLASLYRINCEAERLQRESAEPRGVPFFPEDDTGECHAVAVLEEHAADLPADTPSVGDEKVPLAPWADPSPFEDRRRHDGMDKGGVDEKLKRLSYVLVRRVRHLDSQDASADTTPPPTPVGGQQHSNGARRT